MHCLRTVVPLILIHSYDCYLSSKFFKTCLLVISGFINGRNDYLQCWGKGEEGNGDGTGKEGQAKNARKEKNGAYRCRMRREREDIDNLANHIQAANNVLESITGFEREKPGSSQDREKGRAKYATRDLVNYVLTVSYQ